MSISGIGTANYQVAGYEKRQEDYDLENPLEPISQRSLQVQQQIMKEKAFYQSFINRLEKL